MIPTNRITQPEELVEVIKVGPGTLTFVFDTGKELTASDIVWSTFKNRDEDTDITGGFVNFSQSGSNTSIVGAKVGINHPINYGGVNYTSIPTLITGGLVLLNI